MRKQREGYRRLLVGLCAAAPSLLLSSCIVFPTERTYFQPDDADGTPQQSVSCGYFATAKDSLAKDADGLHIEVTPDLYKTEPITVTFYLGSRGPRAEWKPDQFELHSVDDRIAYKPIEVTTYFVHSRRYPYFSERALVRYSPTPEQVTSITLVIPKGSVLSDGHPIEVQRFRFRKVTTPDFYYGSVNC